MFFKSTAALIQRIFLFILPMLLLAATSCHTSRKQYVIGIDPNWYSLNLMGKEPNVLGFSYDLLKEIAYIEKIHFKRLMRNWDNLLEGLVEGKCDGILSSLYPYIFNLSSYQFSECFLKTGPVLIIREGETIDSLHQLKGKEIAVDSPANEALLIRRYPGVIVRYYAVIPEILNDLIKEKVDGVLVPFLPATAFVEDIYLGKVKIASPPLDDKGLRLVTLHGEEEMLIKRFNAGLRKLQQRGIYQKLLKKWNLKQ